MSEQPTVEQFRIAAAQHLQKNRGNPESLGIFLRHHVHPSGYALAFDYMRVCSELTGEPLTEDGVWDRGAKGELWLAKALTVRRSGVHAEDLEWDAFAGRWVQKGPTSGPAITHVPVGA